MCSPSDLNSRKKNDYNSILHPPCHTHKSINKSWYIELHSWSSCMLISRFSYKLSCYVVLWSKKVILAGNFYAVTTTLIHLRTCYFGQTFLSRKGMCINYEGTKFPAHRCHHITISTSSPSSSLSRLYCHSPMLVLVRLSATLMQCVLITSMLKSLLNHKLSWLILITTTWT